MADVQFVTSRLATGATVRTPEDALELKAAGITAVINAGDPTDEQALYSTLGLAYLANTVPDDGNPATHGPDWFGRSLAFGLSILAQSHQRLYVHCNEGINRGPSTTFAILLALGWLPDAAEALIRSARPRVGLAYKAEAISAVPSLGFS